MNAPMSNRATFLITLEDGVRRCDVAGKSLLVAVSGGADSVALLRGLLLLEEPLSLSLRVAHFNHQLRGADSNADAEWVRSARPPL